MSVIVMLRQLPGGLLRRAANPSLGS